MGTLDAVAKALAARADRRAALTTALLAAALPVAAAAKQAGAKHPGARSNDAGKRSGGADAPVSAAGRCVAVGDPCSKKKDKCCNQGRCKGKVCKPKKGGGGGTVSSATFDEFYSGDTMPYRPKGIALGYSGKAYVSENLNNRLLVFKDDVYSTRYSSTASRDFEAPYGVAVDGSDYLYVANSGANNVMQLETNGTFVASWTVVSGSDLLSRPRDVAVDGDGNVFVADSGKSRIVKFDSNGNKLAIFGPSTPDLRYASLSGPEGVAVTSSGKVFISDTGNNRVVVFSSSGTALLDWNKSGGPDRESLNTPRGIAVDGDQNVYVADTDNDQVAVFDAKGGSLFVLSGPGGASGSQPNFNQPWSVDVRDGQLVVADQASPNDNNANGRVAVFNLS